MLKFGGVLFAGFPCAKVSCVTPQLGFLFDDALQLWQ